MGFVPNNVASNFPVGRALFFFVATWALVITWAGGGGEWCHHNEEDEWLVFVGVSANASSYQCIGMEAKVNAMLNFVVWESIL